jgi:hypothetical protein
MSLLLVLLLQVLWCHPSAHIPWLLSLPLVSCCRHAKQQPLKQLCSDWF